MHAFKLLWDGHKWTGVVLGLLLCLTAGTGFLLQLKKEYAWIQPKTQRGTEAPSEALLPLPKIYEAAFAVGREELQSEKDIDRIDFRPGKRVHKVRARENDLEIQVDAVTGEVLSVETRTSDWIERLHDGSGIAKWFHDFVMPLAAIGLTLLALSGYAIWIWPQIKKRRARRRRAQA